MRDLFASSTNEVDCDALNENITIVEVVITKAGGTL